MASRSGIETDRAALLAQYDLDSADTGSFDALADFAAALCEAPVALVSIVEADRQRFIGRTGLDADEAPRAMSCCAHAMLGDALFVVADATLDPRFMDDALVVGAPHARFYAGAPLISADGVPLGALCVMDGNPRAALTALQHQGLMLMARQVVDRLEARRAAAGRAEEQRRAAAAADSVERFRALADTMPQMVWSTLPGGHNDYFNARWEEYTGVPRIMTAGHEWGAMFHPDDRERARTHWQRSLESGEPYEMECRLRHHSGEYRWALGRARPVRDADGEITRWIGTCTDIHEHKLMLEERDMIAHELSHRIKNIFSVIAGLISLSARENPPIRDVAEDLRDRILALGRAHDFVRLQHSSPPVPPERDGLWGVLDQLFLPYAGRDGSRIMLSGINPAVDDRSATPLALLFHELVTNAAQYGALSAPEGRVRLTVAEEGADIRIDWREEGGPGIARNMEDGFGGRLMALSVERQLGGRMAREWHAGGLRLSLWIPSRAMSRAAPQTE
ncbi:MAG: PAS domain-containing protein [Sphingobium sp.]